MVATKVAPSVEQGRTIYIIGAGISGLTLALSLAHFGATVVVLERTARPHTQGAGLQISPNARRVLDRLGVSRALDKVVFEPEAIDLYPFRRPEPLAHLTLGSAARERFDAPYAVAHRADLLETLHAACKRFANIDVNFGVRSFDIETHARGLSMIYEDSAGNLNTTRPFAVIGADGVHSPTRTEIMGGPEATYSGYVAWRSMLSMDALGDQIKLDRTSLLWGPGFHAVAYPIPHRQQINLALFTKEKETQIATNDMDEGPTLPKLILKSALFDAIIEVAGKNWRYWPLYAVKTKRWHDGPVGLIGDAAHAMLPFQAQGAAMGIEDAAILAPLLMTEPNATSALARYQAQRQPRTTRVSKLSARNGSIFHLEWPFTIARDLVVAAQSDTAHFSRLGWIYDYDPTPEVNTARANSADSETL